MFKGRNFFKIAQIRVGPPADQVLPKYANYACQTQKEIASQCGNISGLHWE